MEKAYFKWVHGSIAYICNFCIDVDYPLNLVILPWDKIHVNYLKIVIFHNHINSQKKKTKSAHML